MKFILKRFGQILKEAHLEDGQEYLIGRHKDCDFVLEEKVGLSRKHLKIYQSLESGNWIVESISDSGGLFLEEEEVDGVELEESSQLQLKNYTLEFVKEESKKEEQQAEDPLEHFSSALEEKKEKKEKIEKEVKVEKVKEEDDDEDDLDGRTRIFSDTDLVYSLHIYIDGELSDHVRLSGGDFWIVGRSEDCDISIDYNILTRKHLKITKKNEKFYIEDLGSSNKTFLNKQELQAGEAVLLRADDEISVSDLKIVFEIRNKNFKQVISQLPAVKSEEEEPPAMAFPKVVLEEISEEKPSGKKISKGIYKKIIFSFIVLLCLGLFFYFQHELDKKKTQKQITQQQKDKEQKAKLEVFYTDALNNRDQKRYQICIDQLEELHRFSSTGDFKDSQRILVQCQNGLESQKQKEERLSQEEARKETEKKIQSIVEKCKKEYKKELIKTEEDLNRCAEELLEGIDPANSEISAIRMELTEEKNLKRLEEQKQKEYKELIQRKKTLYKKAKKIRDTKEVLKVVKAYNVFLESAKGFPELRALSKRAKQERDTIQKNYDDERKSLHQSCERLIKNNKMKEAYYDCQRFLAFKKDDEQAKKYIKLAKQTLREELKPLYEQSMQDESFSKIQQAKKLWKLILDKDINDGYYYRKALSQIKKYK